MQELLERASQALAANNADCLEELCRTAQVEAMPIADKAAFATALLAFQRQVNSARQNVILRERLLEMQIEEQRGGVRSWAR